MSSTSTTVTTTNPRGRCFVSYRRVRLSEVERLIRALHEFGVPTWQDLTDLNEQPLEASLRRELVDVNLASGVLWVTPEVAGSPVILNIEVPALADRGKDDELFSLVPVAAGGLSYADAAATARSDISLNDFSTWNIVRVEGDPATDADIEKVATRVLNRRVAAIHKHLPAGEPLIVDVYTRTPAAHHPDATLTIDFTHLFDGRSAKPGGWDKVTRALHIVKEALALRAPGRPVHFRGLVGLPAAVALGTTMPATLAMPTAWIQRRPGDEDSLYGLAAKPTPSGFRVDLVDSDYSAVDLAVLVSASENTVPAFRATRSLGPFRGIIQVTPPDGYPHEFNSPGEAVDLAQKLVREIRTARSRYGKVGAVHLFIAGPAGLTFLIGQTLNTLGRVVTYEHLSSSGTGEYVEAVVLTPSS